MQMCGECMKVYDESEYAKCPFCFNSKNEYTHVNVFDDKSGYTNDEDYIRSLKKDDSYHFSYLFEYIAKNHGNDNYDIETTNMEVSANWSDVQLGYVISYNIPEMYKIDSSQGNSSEEEFFIENLSWRLISDLEDIGIGVEAIVSF